MYLIVKEKLVVWRQWLLYGRQFSYSILLDIMLANNLFLIAYGSVNLWRWRAATNQFVGLVLKGWESYKLYVHPNTYVTRAYNLQLELNVVGNTQTTTNEQSNVQGSAWHIVVILACSRARDELWYAEILYVRFWQIIRGHVLFRPDLVWLIWCNPNNCSPDVWKSHCSDTIHRKSRSQNTVTRSWDIHETRLVVFWHHIKSNTVAMLCDKISYRCSFLQPLFLSAGSAFRTEPLTLGGAFQPNTR